MRTILIFATVGLAAMQAGNLLDVSGEVRVRTTTTLDSRKVRVGDAWDGSIAADVVRNGEVVLRRGTPVEGSITEVLTLKDAPVAKIGLKLVSINGQLVKADAHEALGDVVKKKASRTMTGWAVAGALVGGILHGGKGAAIGAGAGAGVGAARANAKDRYEALVPAESVLVFQLR